MVDWLVKEAVMTRYHVERSQEAAADERRDAAMSEARARVEAMR